MRTDFITSARGVSDLPGLDLVEFAFVGRSNVGKSALLNGLVGARIARISKTPGRTQMINFFEVSTGTVRYALADLPGYGFAKAPKEIQRSWQALAEGYLETRATLACVLLLVDVRRGVQEDDLDLYRWLEAVLEARKGRIRIVATKADKLSKAHLKPALWKIADAFSVDRDQVTATSATSRLGLEDLRAELETVVLGDGATG